VYGYGEDRDARSFDDAAGEDGEERLERPDVAGEDCEVGASCGSVSYLQGEEEGKELPPRPGM